MLALFYRECVTSEEPEHLNAGTSEGEAKPDLAKTYRTVKSRGVKCPCECIQGATVLSWARLTVWLKECRRYRVASPATYNHSDDDVAEMAVAFRRLDVWQDDCFCNLCSASTILLDGCLLPQVARSFRDKVCLGWQVSVSLDWPLESK